MKLKNILVTNEKRELVYVGEDIRPVVMCTCQNLWVMVPDE